MISADDSRNPMGDGSSSNNTPTSTATNYKHLTEADVNSGKYSIQDVVFPLIGIDTKYRNRLWGYYKYWKRTEFQLKI